MGMTESDPSFNHYHSDLGLKTNVGLGYFLLVTVYPGKDSLHVSPSYVDLSCHWSPILKKDQNLDCAHVRFLTYAADEVKIN